MAVMLTTSLGDVVIDLHTEQCPLAAKNFLKLCKIKYYNNCLFHMVQKDFIAQTGDPTGTGSGGDSIYKSLYGEQARFFNDEIHPDLKHNKIGTVSMASAGENLNASQFYITLRDDLDYLDGKHTVFGEVGEGLETLLRINEAYVDEKGRPYKNIRIKHTYILEDPFEDPVQLLELVPERSPELGPLAEGEEVRLEDDWVPLDEQLGQEELEKSLRRKEAQSRAVVLEMVGDIPEAEIKPPENVLFVCKLNPVTQEEDLEIIFSRFGKIISADIIRDYKTGDSLCYAFIEFETQEACEGAYFKMDNVLIDDRRIHVDFSQSVSKLWTRYRRFGKTDKGDGEGTNFAPDTKGGHGCYKCGEAGHFAKDCPNQSMNQAPQAQEGPKYKLRDTEGQHGESGKMYDMLFEYPLDEANKHAQDFKNGDRKYYHERRSLDEERRDAHRSKEDGRTRESSYRQGASEKIREKEKHADRGHVDHIHGQGKEKTHDERLQKDRQFGRHSSRNNEPRMQSGLGEEGYSRDGHDDRDERPKRRRVSPRKDGHSTSKQNDRQGQHTKRESGHSSRQYDRDDGRQKTRRFSPTKLDHSSRHYERGDEGRKISAISTERHSRGNDVDRHANLDSHRRRIEGSPKSHERKPVYGNSHRREGSSKDHHSRRMHDGLEKEHSRPRREEKRAEDD